MNSKEEPPDSGGGDVYSDPEAFSNRSPHYVVVVRKDGSEMIVTMDYLLYIAWGAAEAALQRLGESDSRVLIIDAETHQAVRCFEKGTGLIPDWSEDDPERAMRRARSRAAGQQIVPPS